MGISTLHPYYSMYTERWVNCRQTYEGEEAIKAAGVRYLPKLTGQTDDEYEAYKKRALFYSITSKTLSALVGMATDQLPEISYPDRLKSYFEDAAGVQFYELLGNIISELLLMGRIGVLVDRPVDGGKPYITVYPTEAIINWRQSDDGRLTMVVLKEGYLSDDVNDEYNVISKIRYRKLKIVDGKLQITLHTDIANSEDYAESAMYGIRNTGIDMDYIPFFCATPDGMNFNPVKPPMSDIVNINLSHYRTSADLEHGRHFTGLPTPYVTGADSSTKLHIGSTTAWLIPNEKSVVGFLEFTGQGLLSLEKALTEKQGQLASLSARLIDNSSRGSEAADTVRLRYLSETSSLRVIVRSAQAMVNAIYKCIANMEGLNPDTVNIGLNSNFLDSKMSAAELTAWVQAYLSRGISKEIFINALRVGRALPAPGEPIGVIPEPPEPNKTGGQ